MALSRTGTWAGHALEPMSDSHDMVQHGEQLAGIRTVILLQVRQRSICRTARQFFITMLTSAACGHLYHICPWWLVTWSGRQ